MDKSARARSHSVTGLALFAAISVNSCEMQSDKTRPSAGFSALPASGEPNRTGAYTRNPASRTQPQKRASVGVKPYTSWMTITALDLSPRQQNGFGLAKQGDVAPGEVGDVRTRIHARAYTASFRDRRAQFGPVLFFKGINLDRAARRIGAAVKLLREP